MVKISDGMWRLREGVKVGWATEVQELVENDTGAHIVAATTHIRHRGDTLQGPTLDIDIDSPCDDIVRVKLTHFSGLKPRTPTFALFPDESSPPKPNVKLEKTEESFTITSGTLSARVSTKPSKWGITFIDKDSGEQLTAAEFRSQGVADVPTKWTLDSASEGSCITTDFSSFPFPEETLPFKRYIVSQLSLGVGELIYGMGERFGPFIRNGSSTSIWNQDGGTSSEQAYKNVSFYMSNRGHGVFVNHPGEVEFSVSNEKASRVITTVEGESLEYFIIKGTPKEVLSKYTLLTGRPPLLPAWSYGLWLTTSFTTSYDEETVTKFLTGMKERNLPLSVFHLDCFWMRTFKWCDFVFDPVCFPDPKKFLTNIKTKFGVKVCLWINPYVGQSSVMFKEGFEGDYFIKRRNGDVYQIDLWQPGLAIVDFTNPAACKWYSEKLEKLMEIGADSFKTDFAERIPHKGVVYHDGSDPVRMHNYYAYQYNQVVFNTIKKVRGEGEALVFARSGCAGSQRLPVPWGGDCESHFPAMAESLRGGLSLALSGFSYWSHDIGGFEGLPDEALFKRWLQFGLLSSHSRLHGSSSYRVPWLYGEEACDVARKFTVLKARLMPYFYAKSIEAHETGVPIMRPMLLEFPDCLISEKLDRQYMLGESLLVAPVFHEKKVSFYVPEGVWTSLLDDRVYVGGKYYTEEHDFLSLPLLVRQGTVLVIGKSATLPDNWDWTEDVELRIYGLEDGEKTVTIPRKDGKGVDAQAVVVKKGKDVKVQVTEGSLKITVARNQSFE
ncbi:glycoside hydrolase family 31 protein [Atractiella rhizophila]|nr:glycoside hydrolase family 31 protein [Atractiella rhizophila]